MSDNYVDMEDNPVWEAFSELMGDHWEPFEEDDADDDEFSVDGCAYCGTTKGIREDPDPFGYKTCCQECFDLLIG